MNWIVWHLPHRLRLWLAKRYGKQVNIAATDIIGWQLGDAIYAEYPPQDSSNQPMTEEI